MVVGVRGGKGTAQSRMALGHLGCYKPSYQLAFALSEAGKHCGVLIRGIM